MMLLTQPLMVFISAAVFPILSSAQYPCMAMLPSFPLCAQCPAQNILLYGKCTTDFACVCKDADLTNEFLGFLRIACAPPHGSEVSYQSSLGDFIDLCSKKGYDVSGAAGAAALVPPSGTISKNPPKSTQHSQTTAIASGSAPAASASATGTSGIDSLNRGDKTSIALAAAAVCLVRGLWFR